MYLYVCVDMEVSWDPLPIHPAVHAHMCKSKWVLWSFARTLLYYESLSLNLPPDVITQQLHYAKPLIPFAGRGDYAHMGPCHWYLSSSQVMAEISDGVHVYRCGRWDGLWQYQQTPICLCSGLQGLF